MAALLRKAPLLSALLLVAVVITVWTVLPVPDPGPAPPPSSLAALGDPPDWSRLDPYQGQLTREEFTTLLTGVFTIGDRWKSLIEITEEDALIARHSAEPKGERYTLSFAPERSPAIPARYWRSAAELPPAPAGRPLDGLRIAIDPGHIGGDYAQMEARWFQIGEANVPVMEGELTLLTAQLLKPQLEALGATVELVRSDNAPVSDQTVEDFEAFAARSLSESAPDRVRALAEKLFYRTAEIRARAKLVNETLRPDVVLCLHFNAEGWGDPTDPRLSTRNHFHIILNGAYTEDEIVHDDERFEMLLKIAQGIHAEELALAGDMAEAFRETTGLPPYKYEPLSRRAIRLDDSDYLWARNLLANRLYECPVLFLEPYVMNSEVVHARVQAGDYEGLREVAGELRPSIFREYADAVTLGLERYYKSRRNP